jgi:hypothetical protein
MSLYREERKEWRGLHPYWRFGVMD